MLQVHSPSTGVLLGELVEDDPSSVNRAAQRARDAQRDWASNGLAHRSEVLRRCAALLEGRVDALASLLSAEVGKPFGQARGEVAGTIARLEFFLEHAPAALAPEVAREEPGLSERVTHDPLGLVANISAWNYPYFVSTNVLFPALLAGNAVLFKPSELAALSGLEMTALLHEAGVPDGVLQALIGGPRVGAAVLAQPLDAVFFTGSAATGGRVAAAVAPRAVPLQLELGGKDPAYVCDDVADLEGAAAALADGAFYNAGQSCCAVERIYVHEAVAERFIEALLSRVEGFVVGPPEDPETSIGPLTRRAQLAVLEAQLADALAKGARVRCGGRRLEGPGNYFAPTVVTEVDHGMTLMREESFGPVIGVQVVASDARAVELMNDTRVGLTAAVYSAEQGRAEAILGQLDTGSAYWNCCDRVSPYLPWSGRRDSGLGSTLSKDAFRSFTRARAWHMRSPARA